MACRAGSATARTVDGVAGGTCGAGDSGGPLVTTAFPPVLLGVVSSAVAGLAGAPTCWSSRVDAGPYRDWLDRLIAQPGAGADSATAPGTPSSAPHDPTAAVAVPPPVEVPGPPALTAAELGALADTAPGRLALGRPVTSPGGDPVPVGVVSTG